MTVKTLNIPIMPQGWQADVCRSMGQKTVLNIHRGGGKTYLALYRLIHAAMTTPAAKGTTKRFAYVGPSIQQAKQTIWSTLTQALADIAGHKLVSFNGNDLTLNFSVPGVGNNQIILTGHDNPDKARGLHLHGLVLDEAQECPLEVWNKVLMPTTNRHDAWVLMIGTPKGPQGLFYDTWCRGNDGADRDWISITRTIYETGALPPKKIEEIKRSIDQQAFEQEYLCSFEAAIENRVYYNFDPRKAIPVEEDKVPHIRTAIKDRMSDLYVGLDFNVGVMVAVIGQKHGNTLEIINEIVLTDTTTEEMAVTLRRHYPNRRIYICPDASGSQRNTAAANTNHEILRQHGFQLLVPPKNPPVLERVQAVNILLENASGQRRMFVGERCVKVLESLTKQEFNEHTGQPDKKKGYDHAADALGYLVWQTFPINQPKYKKKALRF